MRLLKYIIPVFLLFSLSFVSLGQTVEEQREKADKLFEKKQFVEATKEYVHLLSLQPRDHTLNFKYGACLLYNSDVKSKAFRYLKYSIEDAAIDPRAYYYLGRAYHLNFQFGEAQNNYQIYKDKIGNKIDKNLEVQREIEMCNNGKRLLSTFTDIIVAEKQEIGKKTFFNIYSDSKTVGGDILVTAAFQSKLDKKMGHVPIVHYPPNAKKIFYSSYGTDISTGKDIYIRRKLPDGKWGEPQLVPGGINTTEDEDFPYLHPSGRFLYFSSRGHNSMGGYDIFKSEFDPNTNLFKSPENMDFAISSPDDDLFYVVDSLYQNAYFASARQSQDGKLHVYKVKVVRIPPQEIIVMGKFESEIDPKNTSMHISLTSFSSKQPVGEILANKVGKYSFVFPKGGKYEYLIDVDGSDAEYKFVVELPFLTEFRPLKQRIVHKIENGNEVIRIYNLFDETVTGAEAEALIAEVILRKSKLDVNIDNFNLEELEKTQAKDGIIAELGFKNMSLIEIADQLDGIVKDIKEGKATILQLESNMGSEILAKTERIGELQGIEDELLDKAIKEKDAALKYKLISEAQQKAKEKNELIRAVNDLIALREETVLKLSKGGNDEGEIADLAQEYRGVLKSGNEEEALQLLRNNNALIAESKGTHPELIISELIDENIQIRGKIKHEKQKLKDYARIEEQLEQSIALLENQLIESSKRKAEGIKNEIASKEEELNLVQDEIEITETRVIELNRDISANENNIASLQNAMDTDFIAEVDESNIEKAESAIAEIQSKDTFDYETELAAIDVGESNGGNESDKVLSLLEIKEQKIAEEQKIDHQEIISEDRKLEQLMSNNDEAIALIDIVLETLDTQIAETENPNEKGKLISDKKALSSYRGDLVVENVELTQKAEGITQITDSGENKNDFIQIIREDYGVDIVNQLESENTTKEKLVAQEKSLANYERALDESLLELIAENSSQNENKIKWIEEELENVRTKLTSIEKELIALNNPIEVVEMTKDDWVEEVFPDYTAQVEKVNSNENLTELERLAGLQKVDGNLINSLGKEVKSLTKKLNKSPEDESIKVRLESLSVLITTTDNDILERSQLIDSLESNSIVAKEVDSDSFVENIRNELLNEQASMVEGKFTSLKDLESQDVILAQYETDLELKIKGMNSGSAEDELKWIQNERDLVIEKRRQIKISMGDLESRKVVALTKEDIIKLYTSNINKIKEDESLSKTAQQEEIQKIDEEVLAEIDKKEAKVEKKLAKSPEDEELLNEKLALEVLKSDVQSAINERAQLIASLKGNSDSNFEKEKVAFTNDLRNEFLNNEEDVLIANHNDLESLKHQDQVLEKYENGLELKLNEAVAAEGVDGNTLTWLGNEIEVVKVKRRTIRISIGDLEQNAIVESNGTDENELEILNKEKDKLENELLNPSLSNSQRKEVESEIEDIKEKETIIENGLLKESLIVSQVEIDEISSQLAELNNEQSPNIEKIKKVKETEEQLIKVDVDNAEKAKSEEEKNYLLNKAAERQDKLKNDLAEVVSEEKIAQIEVDNEITINSKEELIKKKRRFRVRIGDLTNDILRVEKEIKIAKKKNIPALESEKQSLINERSLLESRLKQVDNQLTQFNESAPVVDGKAIKEELTFNEERKIAATEEYENYYKTASEALQIENEIATLESELKEEKENLSRSIAEGDNNFGSEIDVIKAKEAKINALKIELIQEKWRVDQVLPTNNEEAMKIQNLISRGVKPLKVVTLVAAIVNLPADGFAIDMNKKSVYSVESPIPVGVESPSGLVYRVQIGAFSKPIPQDLFSEFTPVSGEKIEGTRITRYMAGFFNSSTEVVDAREQIRGLGYSDAFVVAYCDGKRIGFGDARRREAAGTCVPSGKSEMMLEVATKTAEKLGLPTSNEVPEVPEYSYNQAPGAIDADPIEEMLGLFFTVQIGVYNSPVHDENLHSMTEVITLRLPNGQIRYSSGRFDSVKDALPRRDFALKKGIVGAFVTAYYKGERIPLSKAKALLLEKGKSILQSTIDKEQKEVIVEGIEVEAIRTDSVSISRVEPVVLDVSVLRVQVVTKKTFDVYPRDVLNRYNSKGSFYFDEEDKRVKSVIYKNEDYLPNIYNFVKDLDTVYISIGLNADDDQAIISITFPDSVVPGDFNDWMLRFSYRREYVIKNNSLSVRIYGVEQSKLEVVLNDIQSFGLLPEVLKLTEEELELEENK